MKNRNLLTNFIDYKWKCNIWNYNEIIIIKSYIVLRICVIQKFI